MQKKKHELEHVTPYIWDNPKKFKILNVRIFKKIYIIENIDLLLII